ncbi:MAG: M48 family metallopeptidase [Lachnospiraceae bacterium]|nr:M48 family metallopeptidase [Lachnospiraceae bacterium]
MFDYTLIRSRRRSISAEIGRDAKLVVRCPMRMPRYEIERFLKEKESWIDRHLRDARENMEKAAGLEPVSASELAGLKNRAKDVIIAKVIYYAGILGVTYGRVTIRHQKTIWGSCSRKGNLNFNCMLIKAPDRVIDYVVVHELCHRKEMNHSRRFWSLVESVIPDHKECRKWLRDEGSLYLL